MFGTCLSQPHAGRLQLHDDRTKWTQPWTKQAHYLFILRENGTSGGCLGNLFSILFLFRVSHGLPTQHLTKIVSGIIISYLFFSLIHCSIISKGTKFSMAKKVGIALVFLMLEVNIIPI